MREYARLGIELVELSPNVPDPAGLVAEVTAATVAELEQL